MKSRVRIHLLAPGDEEEFLGAVQRSGGLHGRWTAPPSTSLQFRAHFARMSESGNAGFLVRRVDDHALVGAIELTHVVLGRFRSGYVGYYCFEGHQRQGLMAEGVSALVRHAFGAMKLHRLEANIQPGNLASIALARSCGFAQEGFSPRYLKIGGRWRDHERWAILAS